ncbi:MAG: hypothetical protein Q9204_002121 [Flavoplaca sp. TL-2023a]
MSTRHSTFSKSTPSFRPWEQTHSKRPDSRLHKPRWWRTLLSLLQFNPLSHHNSPSKSTLFPLLHLPPEIRLIIYTHLFTNTTTTISPSQLHSSALLQTIYHSPSPQKHKSILSTSRLITHEAAPIFFAKTRFILNLSEARNPHSVLTSFTTSIGPHFAALITKINLIRTVPFARPWAQFPDELSDCACIPQFIVLLARDIPNLEELRLQYKERKPTREAPPPTVLARRALLRPELKVLVEITLVLVYDPGEMDYFKVERSLGVQRIVVGGGGEFGLVRYSGD